MSHSGLLLLQQKYQKRAKLLPGKTTQIVSDVNITPSTSRRTTLLRRPSNLKLHTYTLVTAPNVQIPRGQILLDCGFAVYRSISKSTKGIHLVAKSSYTYSAIVERVVDMEMSKQLACVY